MSSIIEAGKKVVEDWWNGLPKLKSNNGLPAKGSLTSALVVLESLKSNYDLNIDSHRAEGKAQIKGAGPSKVKQILLRFGESRPFSAEGGRTNRGGPGAVALLLDDLKPLELERLPFEDRNAVMTACQEYLVGRFGEYFERQRVKFVYRPETTSWQTISQLLDESKKVGKEGQVSQYLVGAKLQLRFPDIVVRNDKYSSSDIQLGLRGDFQVNDTVFHVTVAPNQGHLSKCIANAHEGFLPYLLVPDRIFNGAKEIARQAMEGRITVQSIESFVSQNIEELARFKKDELGSGIRRLIETYNKRVDEIEIDKSMLIEIPHNLPG